MVGLRTADSSRDGVVGREFPANSDKLPRLGYLLIHLPHLVTKFLDILHKLMGSCSGLPSGILQSSSFRSTNIAVEFHSYVQSALIMHRSRSPKNHPDHKVGAPLPQQVAPPTGRQGRIIERFHHPIISARGHLASSCDQCRFSSRCWLISLHITIYLGFWLTHQAKFCSLTTLTTVLLSVHTSCTALC